MIDYEIQFAQKTFISVVSVLFVLLRDAGADTTYHIALPTMSAPPTGFDVALLHASPVSGASVDPAVTTPVPGCLNPTAGPDMILDTSCLDLIPQGVGISQKGIRVTHADDFRLHVLPMSPSGKKWGDGYLAIPDEHLGDEYYVVTYCTMGGKCQFSVVGTADGTSVRIEFPVRLETSIVCIGGNKVVSNGTSTPFTLNEDDVLHIESGNDLSGTYISADNKVAVFAGASDVPYATGSGQIFEQLLPTRKWAKEYIVMPNDLNDAGDIIKIITKTDNTEVEITGYSSSVMPKKGKAVERRIDWRMFSRIQASNPILVVQIMSVDLYNDTANIGGPLGMVLLQSPQHWGNGNMTLPCSNNVSDVSSALIAAVGDYGPPRITEITSYARYDIQGTLRKVKIFQKNSPVKTFTISTGTIQFGFYGYCVYGNNESASAMLITSDLTENSTECVPSLSTPGDDIDNDCNEQIDEVVCTQQDLQEWFDSSMQPSGSSDQWFVEVAIPGYIKFEASTCEVAEVMLWCSADPDTHVSFQISPSHTNLHVYGGTSVNASTTPSDCVNKERFWMRWSNSNSVTNITTGTGISLGVPELTVTTAEDCFDMITFHALSGDAKFVIDAGKDCGKIISGTADNHGLQFVVPVSDTDSDFSVYITGEATNKVTFRSPDNETIYTDSGTGSTPYTKTQLGTSSAYTHLLLEADAEVSVYLIMKTGSDDPFFGLHLLPTDILGPAYHVANLSFVTSSVCKVYSIDRQLDVESDTQSSVVEEFQTEKYIAIKFLKAQQVMPVFCGDFSATVVQIPPRETLGTKFFIPSINLPVVSVTEASISVVTTEDSTYIKILGDYDREDVIDEKYGTLPREFVSDEVFTIETNKPVLVYLELEFDAGPTTVVIPPVTQYKNETKFPAFGGTVLKSYGIDNNNATITDPVASASAGGTAVEILNFTEPTFFIAFVNISSQTYVVLSDFELKDENEVCVISADGTNTGLDDDCDGLVDEDVCSIDIVAGETDSDIDGSINEDCDPDVSYTPLQATYLQVDASHIQCDGADSSTNTVSPASTLVPPTPMPTGGGSVSSATTPTVPSESVPTYMPIDTLENATATVPSITSSNTTSAPTTMCDCVCPCGWVNPPNMTEDELKTKVEQIQEKLKIKKTELSAWIRKKTSAQDNRPSATAVGSAGVTFLVITLCAIVLLDCATLVRDVGLLQENLRQAFEM